MVSFALCISHSLVGLDQNVYCDRKECRWTGAFLPLGSGGLVGSILDNQYKNELLSQTVGI